MGGKGSAKTLASTRCGPSAGLIVPPFPRARRALRGLCRRSGCLIAGAATAGPN